jgi:hypothetical protein
VLVVDLLLGTVGLVVLVFLLGWLRRQLLQRGGGTVELSLRLKPGTRGRGWVLGLGRFVGDDLQWYRVFSLAPRPRRTLSRRDLEVVRRREPDRSETYALLKGAGFVMDVPGRWQTPVEAGHGAGARHRLPRLARGAPPGRPPAGLSGRGRRLALAPELIWCAQVGGGRLHRDRPAARGRARAR